MAEKQEFYKLINDKTKVPRLTPVPQIDHLNNIKLERDPLKKFRNQAMKFVRPKPPQTKLSDKWRSSVHRISKTFYTEELIKLAKTIPVQGLSPEWEENILKLIPKTSKRKYILYLMSIMKEIKQNYIKEMENFNANCITNAMKTNLYLEHSEDSKCRKANNNIFNSSFNSNRELILKKYFLSHRLIRTISNIMYDNLPKIFINFEQYKSLEEQLHISKLSEMINNDLQRCAMIVQNQCYNEIVRCMLRMNYLKNDKRLPKLLHSAESFMVQQIIISIINSIDSFIESMKSSKPCIQLKLQLLCRNDKLEIEPSIENIQAECHRIIDNITDIAQDLVPFGEWLKMNQEAKYIKMRLPEWFLNKAHDDLQQVLTDNFKSLSEHYNFVSVRFSTLCSDRTKKQIVRLINKRNNFDVYYSEVNKFNAYLTEINAMEAKVYYNFGILNQMSGKNDLKQNTSEILNKLIEELIRNHQELNRSICMEFESLESRALTIPDDTKSLFELTDYVSYASKVLVKELEIKIQRSVNMLSSLLQTAVLSNEHMELNKVTINWLELIKPVFSQHNIFCEAKKGELEDELQKKINLLNARIDNIIHELVVIDDMDDVKRVNTYREFLVAILNKINQMDNQIERINVEERLFKFPETTFPKVEEIKETLNAFCSLVHIICQWQRDNEVWMVGPFEYLDAEIIEKKTMYYLEKITEMHKMFKVKARSDLTTNKPFKFSGIVDDPDPLQQPAPLKLCWQTLQDLSTFKNYVPLAICMCNPALEKRHWNEMSTIAGINLLPNAGTTLKKIIDLNLLQDLEKYETISIGANKELALQKTLNALIEEWHLINFSISIDETSKLPIIGEIDKIDILLEEQFVMIKKMLSSHFIVPIETKVIEFFQKLCLIRDFIEYWNCVQEQCKYLSSLFSNEIVENHLQTEVDLYKSLMTILQSIEDSLSSTPTFHYITETTNILEKLKQGKYALELIYTKVYDYFEQLRLSFTRLFFLSENEIMKLLFEHEETPIDNALYIKKVFPNINNLKTDEQFNILSIIGDGGEEIKLEKIISILPKSNSVTDWLICLNNEITNVIKGKIDDNLRTFDSNEISLKWIANTPSMVILCVQQIIWTSQIHSAFLFNNLESLKICRDRLKGQKENLHRFLKLSLIRKDREIVASLIVLLIHQEDVTNLLIEKKIHEDTDFDWKCQIRYYYQEERVKVIIINTCIKYAYEYHSSSQRIIVNTPLTERCYRNLMEAYYQNYFGAIVGFSSVGKTETMKNLSRTLAVPFFMFSGEDRQDYNSIGKIFKGLVTMEAWVYFKNFRRIKEEILSVIAQYIFRISQSKSMNSNIINIHGTQLSFNPNCYISFSFNPSLPNLSNLPDNLRLHFRTVCLVNPDLEKICQVELFAAGFVDAKNLANSLTEVYSLCNEQMSSDKKYNLKLRNVKAVIRAASKLKLTYPDEEEGALLLRSLLDLNTSQFDGNDIVIFQSILSKCFQSAIPPPSSNYAILSKAVGEICRKKQLFNYDNLCLRIVQLYEMIRLRVAIIIVGEAFSGKSTVLNILREALLLLQENDNQDESFSIIHEIISPGALSIDRLYGFVDTSTAKWNDGVCSDIIRRFTEDKSTKQKWLIFDGNIRSSWIEQLETALDDSKTLMLTSNERILLTPEIQIFFETSNLHDASPSIISRCGILHIDSQTINWRPLLMAYIGNHINQLKGYENLVYRLFDWSIDPCLKFIHKYCRVSFSLTDTQLVMSTLSLFKMYMAEAIEQNVQKTEKDKNTKVHIEIWLQAAAVMSTNWIFTGILDSESREKFEAFYVSLWDNSNNDYPRPSEMKQFELQLPAEGSIRDNIYIFKGIGNWKYCRELVKIEKINENTLFREPFIPTMDSVKLSLLFNLHVKHRVPFALCGESSNGKTSIVNEYISSLPDSQYISNYFNFNFITKSDAAQRLFLSKLTKTKRYNYGPSKNRFCINFVDDLHATPNDRSNVNSTPELIRQYMNYGFFYDLTCHEKLNIADTMFIATLTTEKNNLRDLCPRLLRHFNLFAIESQSKDNIYQIFSKSLLIELKKNAFSSDVLSSVSSIANAMAELYVDVVKNLRPTPCKILYRFSLHDICRIIKGCGLIAKESMETKIAFIRLWVHETLRVLGDRITNDEDNQWLFSKVRETVGSCFKEPFETVFVHLPKYENNELTKESFRDLAFGNFMDNEQQKRKYEEINSIESLKHKVLQYFREYNEIHERKIDVVITCHAMQHLVRICRILATPGGNLLMISPSGSGRKSLARLAAHIQQQLLFEPITDRRYNNESTWKKDIKSIMIECGTSKKDYTILVSDRQASSEFIQDINHFLSFGEMSELFSDDEQRDIIKLARLDAQEGQRNLELNMSIVLTYFLRECKSRMHFLINISPIGKTLCNYLRKYPKIIDQCSIDWLDWPEAAYEEVATHYLKDANIQESIRNRVIVANKGIYDSARQLSIQYYERTGNLFYVSHSAFVRALKIYADILAKKQDEIKRRRKRYLTGLDKLNLAAREILRMKSALTKLRPQLEASARQTDITMKEIEIENIAVEKATVLVKRDEEMANKKAEFASILKAECESELAVAIPILEDALEALNILKPADITLVKSMKNPPDTVKLVMAAVCVMLNIPSERIVDPVTGKKSTDYWGPSKRLLSDMNFLQSLKDYDKDNISPGIIVTIKKHYMSDKNFVSHIVAKASSAAEGLCKWVRAMVSYDTVVKIVAPKKEKLAAAQRECDEIDAFLNAKRKTLIDLNAKLSALNDTLEASIAKRLDLEKEIDSCAKKLKKAEDLVSGLGTERSRWMDYANKLGKLFDTLAGDVLLSSATITYLSSLDLTNREKHIAEWKDHLKTRDIPFSQEYDFIDFLETEKQTSTWYLSGLPDNKSLIQNAIIMKNSLLWCLFIDPENQANEWIKNMEGVNDLHIVKITDDGFIDKIRKCIEMGKPVLLENLEEELDVTLDPLLSRHPYKIAETWFIDFGQDIISYNPSFRFYLTTRYRKPRYSPDVFDIITVINFCLPADALQERLLHIVVSKEKPELQEKFEKILIERVNNKQIIKQQEDNITHTLATCNANILEDEEAIKILKSSRSRIIDLQKRQEVTKSMKDEIDIFRENYSQFAKYSTDLYGTLKLLPNLNCMYQFSLSWFIQLFKKSIETSNRSVIHKKRIDYLKITATQNLHQSVQIALFERHRLIYSFILCAKALLDTEQVTEPEFNAFVNINEDPSTKYDSEILPNPASSWLADKSWREILRISNSLSVFQNLANSFSINNTRWRKYCNSLECEDCLMPSPWDNKLTTFQKLILIRILRPDKIIVKITEFVESVMGQNNGSFVSCNISRPYGESNCLTPIILILPSYSSPFAIVNKFAKVLGYSAKLHSLSMGPSQGQKAEILIEIARQKGEWVFLHNCHLELPWMMKLEKVFEKFDVSNTSLDFRLWISTYSHKEFPLSILQNSIKVAFDSPYEIKQTLTWAYKSELVKDKEFFEGCPGKDRAFSKLLYGFCLFHAVIRERKHFASQSWNFDYDFDESDLQISIIQLKNWINQYDKVPFKALIYLLGECYYGGKIIDTQDKIYVDNLIVDYCNYKIISDVNYDFDTVDAYRAPKRIEYKEHLKHIRNSIPNHTSPQDFSLDKNADLIKNSNKANDFVNSLSYLNETIVVHDIEIKNNRVKLMVFKILETIPQDFDIIRVQEKYKVSESDLLNCLLIEEIRLYNKFLNVMRDSLLELNKAYNGYLIWTDKMDEISDEIFLDLVPTSWKMHISLCTKKLLSNFITDLLQRIKFMNSWIDNGHPRYYWFGGLMSCKKLLSAIKTMFARDKRVPVDQVTFQFNVLEMKYPSDDICVPENCIYVYGLYLIGAKWNEQSKTLSDSKPKTFYNDMPIVSFELTLKKTMNLTNIYKCPLYVTPNLHNSYCNSENLLDNYILSVNLKSNVNPKIWIKRGTALYCQAE